MVNSLKLMLSPKNKFPAWKIGWVGGRIVRISGEDISSETFHSFQ